VYFSIMSMYAREGKDPGVAAYVARQAYEVVKETMLLDQERIKSPCRDLGAYFSV
jgi:hypothetical protein